MRRLLLITITLLISTELIAIKVKPWLDFSGYTRYNMYIDRRQVFGLGEDYILLYPLPYDPGCNCEDLNKRAQTTMVPIETRLQFLAEGIDVWCSRTWAYLEANFFGVSESTINTSRLRHAFICFEWEDDTLLVGQYWHPFFIDECYPKTISFNLGAPFDIQALNPQFRWTHRYNEHEIMLAIMEENTEMSNGPKGFSTEYMRNGVMPDMQAQYKYCWGEHIFGAGVEVKRLAPRLQTDKCCATSETIVTTCAMAYGSFNFHQSHINTKVIYQENATDLLMLSSYGVATRDPFTDIRTYTPLRAATWWLDMYYELPYHLEPGLFVGYSKNLGSSEPLYIDPITHQPIIYSFPDAEKISYLLRTSPRLRWYQDPVLIGFELEYTQSSSGLCVASSGKPINPTTVYNVRFLVDFYYFF
jgi:hypothetical protein